MQHIYVMHQNKIINCVLVVLKFLNYLMKFHCNNIGQDYYVLIMLNYEVEMKEEVMHHH